MSWTIEELDQHISALQTTILNHASTGVLSYEVNGRQVNYEKLEDLKKHLIFLKSERDKLIRIQKQNLGEGNSNKILVRF